MRYQEAELYKRKILNRLPPPTATVDNGLGQITLLGPASLTSPSNEGLQRPASSQGFAPLSALPYQIPVAGHSRRPASKARVSKAARRTRHSDPQLPTRTSDDDSQASPSSHCTLLFAVVLWFTDTAQQPSAMSPHAMGDSGTSISVRTVASAPSPQEREATSRGLVTPLNPSSKRESVSYSITTDSTTSNENRSQQRIQSLFRRTTKRRVADDDWLFAEVKLSDSSEQLLSADLFHPPPTIVEEE